MKKTPLASIIVSLALSLPAFADIKSDMADDSMTLVQVVQSAQQDGMAIDAIVAKMIAADPAQSSAIIASAIVLAPELAEQIVAAAIGAGDRKSVV